MTYVGNDEYEISQGEFDLLASKWEVGSLPPGSSATLDLNYYVNKDVPWKIWGEVTSAYETDDDSRPNNAGCCVAEEDDEALLSFGNDALHPDLVFEKFETTLGLLPGDTLFYNYEIGNIGSLVGQNNIKVRFYLSKDSLISSDDVLIRERSAEMYFEKDSIFEDGFWKKLHSDTDYGEYILIAQLDVNDKINEQEEGNNLAFSPVTVGDLNCDATLELVHLRCIDNGTPDDNSDDKIVPYIHLHGDLFASTYKLEKGRRACFSYCPCE